MIYLRGIPYIKIQKMEILIFAVILVISYLIGTFASTAIIFPFTVVIPKFRKKNIKVPFTVFIAPILWIIVLFFFTRYALDRWELYRHAIYIGVGIPFALTVIKSIKGGEDLEADIEDTYGIYFRNDDSNQKE